MDSILYFFRNQRVLPSVESNDPPATKKAAAKAAGNSAAGSPTSSSSSPSAASAASLAVSGMSDTPSPPQRLLDDDRTPTTKRKGAPLESGRTAAVVAKRWKALNKEMDRATSDQLAARIIRQPVSISAKLNGAKSTDSSTNAGANGRWAGRFNPLHLVQSVKVKEEDLGDEARPARNLSGLHDIPAASTHDNENDTVQDHGRIVVARSEYDLRLGGAQEMRETEVPDSQEITESEAGFEAHMRDAEDDDVHGDGDNEEDTEEDEDDSGWYDPALSANTYPNPGLPQQVQSFTGSLDRSGTGQPAADTDDYDSDDLEDEDDDDGVDENWDWLFEAEATDANSKGAVPDESDYYWSVDVDERTAYEQGVAAIEGYNTGWTADEKRLHRLLSLRGFHPLLPATWTRDFLGVPVYPSLFATAHGDALEPTRPVTINNFGSQFHATKALRALFDLQSRVSGLRQTGHNTARIGAIIERELRRYIAWAAADAGLDRCAPLAAMPNIAAKQFRVGRPERSPNKKGKTTKKRSIARQVQDFFGDWVARYRAYYAGLPAFDVDEAGGETHGAGAAGGAGGTRRLRPPRLLYGFVIVQHAVMLLVVDAAGNRSSRHPRPRCLADFNLSFGDRWLDASLSVAIPVHVARAAQMRCRRGLKLPTAAVDDADEDA
ncbi:uncharacterized protein SPSK_01079 [Sporothrix schenckii 1099-18]|uniref:Uncharacterized protein n=1 Tax=Sporothrix schenckii 1099-18 TaxID=1397361 RepID=A0A0F2LVJ8_SPOSC|nr:uncharacterized protein SPSK_01079 [Sporothrix schenckii 1099-18]KJR81482.1 hypothetical protein SPSK_01079 [Sporothrix schenckii 1099-18]